jgi:hypothetical protein
VPLTKPDDSSLTPEEYAAVRRSALELLNKGAAWDRFPTPVDELLEAASLKAAPVSAFDMGVVERYARMVGGVATKFLKSAIDKVLGILDVFGNIVHVDPTVNKEKQKFIKLHEAGHSEMPHQRRLFRWIQDCNKTLDHGTSELFEREANNFATIVLFQDSRFAQMAADSPFGIKVPLGLGRKFGGSAYASMREYVRKHEKACAVIVLDAPQPCELHGLTAAVRRADSSPEFTRRFGALQLPATITSDSELARFIPANRMSSPRTLSMQDRNGDSHEFVAEGFRTPRNVFILIHARATLTRTTIILPSGFGAAV